MKDNTVFQSEEHEKAWLIRTSTNLCRDFHKSRHRRNTSLNEAVDVAVEQPFATDETLKKVLDLPPKYKTPVYMYYYEGYSTVEISKILQVKESTVRSHLHKGRKLLKLEMEGDQVERE